MTAQNQPVLRTTQSAKEIPAWRHAGKAPPPLTAISQPVSPTAMGTNTTAGFGAGTAQTLESPSPRKGQAKAEKSYFSRSLPLKMADNTSSHLQGGGASNNLSSLPEIASKTAATMKAAPTNHFAATQK